MRGSLSGVASRSWNDSQWAEVVGHVVAAERQHREGVAPEVADGAGGRRRRLRGHDRPEEDAVVPVEGLVHERDDRRRGGRRTGSPRSGRPRGPPTRGRSPGPGSAGAVKREFGWAAGLPVSGVHSAPVQSVQCAGGSRVSPSHQTSPSSVRAVLVKMQFGGEREDGVRVRLHVRARRHPEETRLGVDRPQRPVGADLHPADVVADRLDLPAGHRRDEHREVRLAAGRGEGAR